MLWRKFGLIYCVMKDSYVIYWKSKVNGRSGRGTRQFSLQEAEALAQDLNLEYPEIEHDAVKADSTQLPTSPHVLLSAA